MLSKLILILKNQKFWLILIILLGFVLRLYKIDNPVADWHSWRQADTAAVARNFYKEGFNPFLPKYDDMTGVSEHPGPNPQRFRFVEFPIYNCLVYFVYLLNGGVDEKLARLTSSIISIGSLLFVYLIAKRYLGTFTALLSAFLFAILPFNIFFSRVILPEPILVFFSLGMFYFADLWIERSGKKLFGVSVFFAICALLTKPYSAFYLLPLIYSYYQKEGRWWPVPKRYFLWAVCAILPFAGWRIWINQHPEGIPAAKWLLNGNGIRFKPVFFKWILQDRFGREILGVTGSILFFIGIFIKPFLKEKPVLHFLVFSCVLFLVVFATGNVQHDYYQTFIIPAVVIFVARGFMLLCRGIDNFLPRIITIPTALLFLFMTIYTTWEEVKGLYQINNGAIIEAGKRADTILPKDAVVVAPYSGDTSFLYQTNRTGWPIVGYPIKDLIDMFGVNYFVSVAQDAKTKWVMRKYTVMEETPNYVIIDLTRENPNFDRENDLEP